MGGEVISSRNRGGDRSEDGDGRDGELATVRDWASLSRGREEMRYREEDERLALKTETKETRERL
ncbi:hypothetical protein IGI04_018920 [Brassica rapa subsp. trilocularis]|uniref:Uncharacterized protein n=1 Tax=Brassica rapa subsp. trilocularis TaxID=1813537 RepID=A0ABQ7MGS2_BRACM|nr:hypothetical protein IGI04_018920 [Brassica rapa subsp. trilocularis]